MNNDEKIVNSEKRFNSISRSIARKYAEINNLIEEIKNDSSIEISNIVRNYSEVSNMSVQEKEQRMNEKLDEYQKEYDRVMKSDLSIEEKNIQEDEIFKELQNSIELYEEFGSLSKSDQEKEIDKKRRKIETTAKEQIEEAKNELEEFIVEKAKKEVSYLSYMLKKFNNQKEVYDAYRWLTRVVLDNDELTELYSRSLRETLMRHPTLENIVIAYDSRNINIGDNYLKPLYGDKESIDTLTNDDESIVNPPQDNTNNIDNQDNLTNNDESIINPPQDDETDADNLDIDDDIDKTPISGDTTNKPTDNNDQMSDEDKLIKDIKEKIEKAEQNSNSYMIKEALNLIEQLPLGEKKDELKDKAYNAVRKIIENLIMQFKDESNVNKIKDALNLIEQLPSEEEKNEFKNKSYEAIKDVTKNLIEQAKEEIELSKDEANNIQLISPWKKLDLAYEIIQNLPDGIDKDELKQEITDTRSIINNVVPITNRNENSNCKWKSVASIAAGIGIGVGIALLPGVGGTIALSAAGTLAKISGTIIEKKREERGPLVLAKPEEIKEINEMTDGLAKKWEKFKYGLKHNLEDKLNKIGDILTNKNFQKATTAAVISSGIGELGAGIIDSVAMSNMTGAINTSGMLAEQGKNTTKALVASTTGGIISVLSDSRSKNKSEDEEKTDYVIDNDDYQVLDDSSDADIPLFQKIINGDDLSKGKSI